MASASPHHWSARSARAAVPLAGSWIAGDGRRVLLGRGVDVGGFLFLLLLLLLLLILLLLLLSLFCKLPLHVVFVVSSESVPGVVLLVGSKVG